NTIGLATFPMTTADQAALGDPLEDLWIQGSTPLSATASAAPTTGNAPLGVSFTGSARGGTAPYSHTPHIRDRAPASTPPKPHSPHPHPHPHHRGHLHRPPHLHAQLHPADDPPLPRHHPGQRRRHPPRGHRLRHADLRAGPADRRLHRHRHRRHPALLLQLEL